MNLAISKEVLKLLNGRHMVLAIFAYLGVLLFLRLILFPGASEDDAEQLFYAQSWSLGYKGNQPPLFTWMVVGLRDLGMTGIAPVLVVKFTALTVFYLTVFSAAKHLLSVGFAREKPASPLNDKGDADSGAWVLERGPVLAVIALPSCFFIGWDAINNYTHSILLAAAMGWTLWAVVRLKMTPSWIAYGFVAAGITVGFLSKYNYGLFFAAVLLAALTHPELRPRILCRRFIVALGISCVLIAPAVAWFLTDPNGLARVTGAGSLFPEASGTFSAAVYGLVQLVMTSVGFLSPLLPIALIFVTRAFGPLNRQTGERAWNGRFLEAYFVSLMTMIAIIILVTGATDVRNNWMMVLFPFSIYLVLRIQAAGLSQRRLGSFAFALGIVALLIPLGLIGRGLTAPDYCKKCNFFQDYAGLAVELRSLGFTKGTIVAVDFPNQVGGNLTRFFGDSRVVSSRWVDYVPPIAKDARSQCLLIWNTANGSGKAQATKTAWDALAAGPRDDDLTGEIVLSLPGNRDRTTLWGYRLGMGRGGCR